MTASGILEVKYKFKHNTSSLPLALFIDEKRAEDLIDSVETSYHKTSTVSEAVEFVMNNTEFTENEKIYCLIQLGQINFRNTVLID